MSQTKRLESLTKRNGDGDLSRRQVLGLSAAAAAWVVQGSSVEARTSETYWGTRVALVTSLAGGMDVVEGEVYTAGGYQYIGTPGATPIPDMPGFLPFGNIHVEHFGAKGDLTWTLHGNGYVRRSGTDDLAAFQAANAWAATTKLRTLYAGGSYFIDGMLEPTCFIDSGNSYRSYLWLRYGRTENGMWFHTSNAGLRGFKVVGQYDFNDLIDGYKPVGGQIGTVLLTGMQDPWVTHVETSNIDIDVLVCRAADTATQNSRSSIVVMCLGYTVRSKFRLGTHGRTNVSAELLFNLHWSVKQKPETVEIGRIEVTNGGAGYTTAPAVTIMPTGGDVVVNPTTATARISGGRVTGVRIDRVGHGYVNAPLVSFSGPGTGATAVALMGVENLGGNYPIGADFVETYHPSDIDVSFSTVIDNADGHNFSRVFELASACSCTVGPLHCRGLSTIYWLSIGDLGDAYTCEAQKGRPARGHRLGFMRGEKMTASAASPYVVYYKGGGTSTIGTEYYPNSQRQYFRQVPMEAVVEGHYITMADGYDRTLGKGIFAANFLGQVDLGVVTTWGLNRAVECQDGVGDVTYRYVDGDGAMSHEYFRGGSILESSTHRGDEAAIGPSNLFGMGYNNRNCAIYVGGDTVTATISASVTAGATEIPINVIPEDLMTGYPVDFGAFTATLRAPSQNGVPFLFTTPIQADVLSGTVVTIDRRAVLDRLVGTFESSKNGLVVANGRVNSADLSRVGFTGMNAGLIKDGASVRIDGDLPDTTGHITPNTSNYTFDIDATSALQVSNGDIKANPRVAKIFNVQRTGASGPWGKLMLVNCRIHDFANLYACAEPSRQVHLVNCYDSNGAPIETR